jgi:hypothetical protein
MICVESNSRSQSKIILVHSLFLWFFLDFSLFMDISNRLRRAASLAFGNTKRSFRGILTLMLVLRFFLSLAQHLGEPLSSTFLIENLQLSSSETTSLYTFRNLVGSFTEIGASLMIDSLPTMPLVLGAGVLGIILRVVVVTAPLRFARVVVIAAVLPACETFLYIPLNVALKRIIIAEYAGNDILTSKQIKQYVSYFYTIHNIADVIGNAMYYHWRQTSPTPVDANVQMILASAVSLACAALVLILIRTLAPRADRPSTSRPSMMCQFTFKSRAFWAFFSLVLSVTAVMSLFTHLELTLIRHLLIELGPKNVFPILRAINPCIVIIVTPFMPWFLQTVFELSVPQSLMVGTAVSALGCLVTGLVFAAFPQWPLWIGFAIGLVLFSIGEVVWSPLLAAYSLEGAPEGHEAIYQSLAQLPRLVTIFFAPFSSHRLIELFCTATHCHAAGIWTSVGLMGSVTPFALILAQRWLFYSYYPPK